MVTTTADPRAGARAIAAAQRRLLQQPPDPTPRTPVHVVSYPTLAMHHAETLPPSPRLLYLHLWTLARTVSGKPCPAWFWHTDRQLTRELPFCERTLRSAKAHLEAQGLIISTDNQGQGRRTTWYHLPHPLPPPPGAPSYRLRLYADELEANGPPPPPLQLLRLLARAVQDVNPTAAALTADLAATPLHCTRLRQSLAARLLGANPWLFAQLRWADAELYQTVSHSPTSILSGQLCLPCTPETDSPSA